jgi:hypothetical protein
VDSNLRAPYLLPSALAMERQFGGTAVALTYTASRGLHSLRSLDPDPTPGEALLPRNYGRGPGQILVNLRVGKTIAFRPEQGTSGNRRYNATISMSGRNLLNHTNPGPIIGNTTSPLFGKANQVAGTLNGEGFSENASNRRLEMQIRLTF